MKVDTMKEKLVLIVIFSCCFSSLPKNVESIVVTDKPISEALEAKIKPSEEIPDQIAQESTSWNPTKVTTVVTNEDTKKDNDDPLKPITRHIRQEDGEKYATTTRNIFDLKDLDPLSAALSAEDYVHQALSNRKSFIEKYGDDTDHEVVPRHTYTDFKRYKDDEDEFKDADTSTYHKKIRSGSNKKTNPNAPKKLKFKDTLDADYYYQSESDSSWPSSSTTTSTAQPYLRPRKRLRTRKPHNFTQDSTRDSDQSDHLDNSDSIVQYHYISPEEAVRHMRRPLVSKSPTIKHSDSSTSTSYYYEPIVTKVVEEEPKLPVALNDEKVTYKWQTHGFGFNSTTSYNTVAPYSSGFKPGAPLQSDLDAYYFTHPTPNPPIRTTSTTTTTTRRPYVEVKDHGYVSQKPRIHKKRPNKPVDNNIRANVYTNSDNGADSYPASSYHVIARPKSKPKPKIIRFKAPKNQKTKIIIRTHRPSKSDSSVLPDGSEEELIDDSDIENVTEYESSESQITPSFKLPPNTVAKTPLAEMNEIKHHTPKFELNDYEKTRVPVYYNVDVKHTNATIFPPFNNGEKKSKVITTTTTTPWVTTTTVPTVLVAKPTPVVRLNPTKTPDTTYVYPENQPTDVENQIHSDDTKRSMMTFSPEDDSLDSVTQKGVQLGDEKDLDASESKPNKFVVLYEYEQEAKKHRPPPPPPRPKTTPKPTIVQQQIHYHHHGGNTETKTRAKHSHGGTYQGSWGGRGGNGGGYDEDDDDEGPDVTHTHHEYVHFEEEPQITHLYNDGPLTDHYNMANPGANAVYDMKTAKDYDFRHTASHDLDTRHVPVGDYDGLRYSHMHNSGKLNGFQKPRNSYGERPYYYYDAERQSDQYDNEAYGSSPQQSVVKPFESKDYNQSPINRQTIKVVDPINPKASIEITKDDYVKHVKLAVEKYLQSKEKAKSGNLMLSSTSKPNYSDYRHYGNSNRDHDDDDDSSSSYSRPRPYLPVRDYESPPKSYLKPLEKPLNYNEGTTQGKVPLNDDTYNKLREQLENSYMTPIKPVTLPPKKLQQLTKMMASTPSSFQANRPDSRPQYSQENQQSSQPNFNIMKTLKYPKDFYGAGKGMNAHIYNLQESLSNDVDLTVKNIRPMGNQMDLSALEVGQTYHHNNHYDAQRGASQAASAFHRPKLHFNQQSHQEINSLTHGNKNNYKYALGNGRRPGNSNSGGAAPTPSPKLQALQGETFGNGAQSNFAPSGVAAGGLGTALNNELQNAPVQIINGIPIVNPYGIDMDTLRYMLGGMPGGMTMTKDPNDPFNMKTLKSIPNIANIPSLSSTAGDSFAFPSMPKPNYGPQKFKNTPSPVKPSPPYPPKKYPGPGSQYGSGGPPKNFAPGRPNGPNPNANHAPYRPNQNGHSYSGSGYESMRNQMSNGRDNFQSANTNNNNYHTKNTNGYNDDGFSPIINPYMNQNDNFNPLAWRQDQAQTPYNSGDSYRPYNSGGGGGGGYNSFASRRPVTTPEPQLYLRTYRRVPNNPSKSKKQKHNREPETSLRPPPPMFRRKLVSTKES